MPVFYGGNTGVVVPGNSVQRLDSWAVSYPNTLNDGPTSLSGELLIYGQSERLRGIYEGLFWVCFKDWC